MANPNKVECHNIGSIEKLQAAIKHAWCREISIELCKNFIKSMLKCLKMSSNLKDRLQNINRCG